MFEDAVQYLMRQFGDLIGLPVHFDDLPIVAWTKPRLKIPGEYEMNVDVVRLLAILGDNPAY